MYSDYILYKLYTALYSSVLSFSETDIQPTLQHRPLALGGQKHSNRPLDARSSEGCNMPREKWGRIKHTHTHIWLMITVNGC